MQGALELRRKFLGGAARRHLGILLGHLQYLQLEFLYFCVSGSRKRLFCFQLLDRLAQNLQIELLSTRHFAGSQNITPSHML